MSPDSPAKTVKGRFRPYVLLCGSLLLAAALFSRSALETFQPPGQFSSHSSLVGLPQIMLWAWERPEDLNFIDPRAVGVAFLAGTLYLRGGKAVVRPRLQPLRVPDGTALMAVVRIETDWVEPPQLSADQQRQAVSAIIKLTHLPKVVAIQIDFDAKASERLFYRGLLSDLRHQFPTPFGLSMTALASWCIHDNWLSDLPVDEAVPMLFRMGADHLQVILHLRAGKDFSAALCQHSFGIATDELLPQVPAARRVYLFHPRPWLPQTAHTILEEVQRWH